MLDQPVKVYGTNWCGSCRRAVAWLSQHQIAYVWIDIDQDAGGEQLVKQVNRGLRSVPTLLFGDGSSLTEPSQAALEAKFGLVPGSADSPR